MFTTITLSVARLALAERLADPEMVRWTAVELNVYLREALRTWNAYTASYRGRGVFSTTVGAPWYQLPTVVPSLRGQTLTDFDLVTDVQYALLEPATPASWTGTAQFTLTDLLNAIQRTRDQFLRDTGAVLTRTVSPISPAPSGRVPLPSTCLTVRRAAWRDPTGRVSALRRDDEWGADHYAPQWPLQAHRPPVAYSVATVPPVQMQLIPPPLDTGALDLLQVAAGAPLQAGTASILGIPDDWAWVVKWGALADLLGRDGLARDPGRAAYANARWRQGIDAATRAAVVLGARINDRTCRVVSVSDADAFSPLWQTVAGTPRAVVTAGQTAIATWPPPGAMPEGGDWSVSLDVVANMAMPSGDGDYLQIGADAVDALLDYAQHLALFKEGPSQLELSQPLAERFFRACGVTLKLQQAQQPARAPLTGQTTQDQRALPREEPVVEATT